MLELVIIRLSDGDLLQQTWITSQVFVARSSFLAVASIQLIYAIFTYRYACYVCANIHLICFHKYNSRSMTAKLSCEFCRDYEVLNHQLLQKLIDKVNIMELNSGWHLELFSIYVSFPLCQYLHNVSISIVLCMQAGSYCLWVLKLIAVAAIWANIHGLTRSCLKMLIVKWILIIFFQRKSLKIPLPLRLQESMISGHEDGYPNYTLDILNIFKKLLLRRKYIYHINEDL